MYFSGKVTLSTAKAGGFLGIFFGKKLEKLEG